MGRATPVRRAAALGAFVAFALLYVAPQFAHAALFDDEEARKRIAATNVRIDQLQKDLDDRVSQLERQLKSGALVDLANNVEALKSDVAKIRGQIEVLTYELEQSQKRQRDLYVDLDARMRKLEGGPGPATDAAPADAPAGGATAAAIDRGARGRRPPRNSALTMPRWTSSSAATSRAPSPASPPSSRRRRRARWRRRRSTGSATRISRARTTRRPSRRSGSCCWPGRTARRFRTRCSTSRRRSRNWVTTRRRGARSKS